MAVFFATVVVVLVIGLCLVHRALHKRSIERNGLPGHARVLTVDVIYRKRSSGPNHFVNAVSPGNTLFVKVDPNDHEDLIVDWDSLAARLEA